MSSVSRLFSVTAERQNNMQLEKITTYKCCTAPSIVCVDELFNRQSF